MSRKIEDEDRKINKALNDEASAIISKLYDQIKTVVDKTAEMNGYHIVFAYPDAVTAKEMNDPMIKELKLKPPAAQPFFVAKHVDMTGRGRPDAQRVVPAGRCRGQAGGRQQAEHRSGHARRAARPRRPVSRD